MTRDADKPTRELSDLHGRADAPGKCYSLGNLVWLAYSIFFFIDPILQKSLSYWLKSLGTYSVFLALYFLYLGNWSKRRRILLVAAIGLLGVASIPQNGGASTFLIYVAALLPFSVESVPILVGVMAGLSGVLYLEGRLLGWQSISYFMTPFLVWVVGVSNLLIAQQKRNDCKLRRAQEENIELAAVAERERIARDLHDVLGHTLSVIVLKTELAGRLLGRGSAENDARAAQEIADVERTARAALAEVREAIGGYRSKGLSAEIEQARLTLDAAGVALECESSPPSLRPNEETVLSLAVREAVTNIVRHSAATRCVLRFERTPDGYDLLQVADNGRGSRRDAGPGTSLREGSAREGPAREGNGLRGMRERVQALGGRFHVDWKDGTKVVVELPHRPVPTMSATLQPASAETVA